MEARQHEVFIPIDYSTDLVSMLSAVTWATLMKGGLAILAKFKAFTADHEGTCEQPLPSWLIDWHLSARLFSRSTENLNNMTIPNIDNAWAIKLFCNDNRGSIVPHTKLILQGMVDPRFHAKDKCVWAKRRRLKDKAVWQVEDNVHPTDLVVYMLDFIGGQYQGSTMADCWENDGQGSRQYKGRGLWLLRPAGDVEFKLIACLSWVPNEWRPLYAHWEWNPGHFRETSPTEQPVNSATDLLKSQKIL